jgi:hypothetical protein
VSGATSGNWIERFRSIIAATSADHRIVLDMKQDACAFSACNAELLRLGTLYGKAKLLALWDGKESNQPGGTAEMVERARQQGMPVDVIKLGDLRP